MSGELLMERTWERIQEKTFTKWVNSHLRKRKLVLENLKTDLSNGVMLINFLEIISNQTLPKYEKKPKIRIQEIGNVSIGLKFLTSQKIKLVNISPEDIVDQKLKLILGLIWTIIQKFQIDDISEEQLSAKEALLLWCQKKTAGYKDCKVENFTWSFQDGLALCALIHRHRPDLLDYSKLNKDNKAENLQLAFDVAERDLGIPKLLDVEDMVDIKPDERSVITYVSQYYHVFSKYNQAEVAGRRIGKLCDLNEALSNMKNDYTDKAGKLVAWINQTTPQMDERNFDGTLDGVKQQIEDFKNYKSDDKPPKAADKANVEALFNNINLKLRANNRSAFEPPAGLAPSDIEALWEKLGQSERDRELALAEELRRQEKLAYLRKRFDLKSGKLEAWLASKEEYLNTEESVNSLNEAETKLKNHDAFDQEYVNAAPRLQVVQDLVKEILALNPPDASAFQTKGDELSSRFSGLAVPQASKRTDLEAKLAKEQKKEELRKEFAKQAKAYNVWNKETSTAVNDHYFGDNLEAVEAAKAKLDSHDSESSSTSDGKKASLDDLWNQLQELGAVENRYTPTTNKDIENQHNSLLSGLEARRAAYQAELDRQLLMEEKRKEFAAKAQEFSDSVAARKSAVDEAVKVGEPEEALASLKSTYQEGKPESDALAALESLQNELLALGIRDNKYTHFTMPDLRALNNKFENAYKNHVASLNDEAELKKEYLNKAQALVDWANGTLPSLSERNFDNTLAGARQKHTEWQTYLTTDKGRKDIDQINANSLFNKIANILSSTGRPVWSPAAPLDPSSVSSLWDQVNAQVKEKDAAVSAELARQEKLHTLVKKFNSDADELEAWTNDKEAYLNSEEVVNDLDTARMKVKFLEVFNSEFANKQPVLQELKELKNSISALNYHDVASVESRCAKLDEIFARFTGLSQNKDKALQAALATQQANEDLRLAFADQARDLSRFIRDASDTANARNFGYSLEDVTNYVSTLDSSDAELNAKADELKSACDATYGDLSSRGISDNRHTTATPESLNALRAQLADALQKRREAYQQELSRQQVNEEKRKNYADKANAFVAHLDENKNTLTNLTGEPDERISAVNNLYQDGVPTRAQAQELAALTEELHSLGVYDNKHTAYSLSAVQTKNNQYDNSVKNFLSDLADEKAFNERSAALQAEYEQAVRLENMRINYAQLSGEFKFFLETANETLHDPLNCELPSDLDSFQNEYNQLSGEKAAQNEKYDKLVALAGDLAANNLSAGVAIEDLTARWNAFLADFDARQQSLAQEAQRLANNEQLRVQFADQAKALQAFINEHSSAVNSTQQGELEDQLKEIQARKPTIHNGASLLEQVGALAKSLEDAGVRSNQHTELNYPTLKVAYEQLVKLTNNKEALIQKEIFQKANSSVSAEQLAEFKEVFEHFDKDKSGSLGRLEFKSCLQSLGEDLADAEIDATIASIGTGGRVPFEAFVNFMSNKAADSDSQPQILEAFRTLSGDKEFVTEDDLRRALPGEKVDFLIKQMPLYKGESGSYDYVAWANSAFN